MSQTNPKDFTALFEAFSMGLINRIISVRQVIDWADAVIEHDAKPDDFIIELAMCGQNNINELISLLTAYVSEAKTRVAGHATLGLLHHAYAAGKVDFYRVVRTMDWLATHDQLSEEECRLMYGIDDAYSMAVDGVYGSVDAVANFVGHLLAFYPDFRLDNVNQWNEIDAVLGAKQESYYQQMESFHPYL
jgi:hypothetical protein